MRERMGDGRQFAGEESGAKRPTKPSLRVWSYYSQAAKSIRTGTVEAWAAEEHGWLADRRCRELEKEIGKRTEGS